MCSWVEKYRPRRLEDIIGQEHIVPTMRHILNQQRQSCRARMHTAATSSTDLLAEESAPRSSSSVPVTAYIDSAASGSDYPPSPPSIASGIQHMILTGRPGIGKTSAVLAMIHEMFEPRRTTSTLADSISTSKETQRSQSRLMRAEREKLVQQRLLRLTAAEARGVDSVRERIQRFAWKKPSFSADYESMPELQYIVFEESELLTRDVQHMLRRTMEELAHVTIFVFLFNHESQWNFVDALRSRCVSIHFRPLDASHMYPRLYDIAVKENVTLRDDRPINREADLSIHTPTSLASSDTKTICSAKSILRDDDGDHVGVSQSKWRSTLIDYIIVQSQGDLRMAIHTLQRFHRMTLWSAAATPCTNEEQKAHVLSSVSAMDRIDMIVGRVPVPVWNELWTLATCASAFTMTRTTMTITIPSATETLSNMPTSCRTIPTSPLATSSSGMSRLLDLCDTCVSNTYNLRLHWLDIHRSLVLLGILRTGASVQHPGHCVRSFPSDTIRKHVTRKAILLLEALATHVRECLSSSTTMIMMNDAIQWKRLWTLLVSALPSRTDSCM